MTLSFRGKTPQLGKAAFVAPNATVCGDVVLEEDASIWFGAVVRTEFGQTCRIGKGSNVQDNCVLHCDEGTPLILGQYVVVGHSAVVHGATVGDDVLIGMHATVLNGAKIGSGAVIAGGTVVRENMVIPENALVAGVPARIVRIYDPPMREKIRANAQRYIRWAKEYAEQLGSI